MSGTFIGVDLGWYGKPSGLASIRFDEGRLRLDKIGRVESHAEIFDWIAGGGDGVIAVDAPTIIRNPSGIREAERELNADYRRFHAGCHAANLGLPFAEKVTAFSRQLEALGFAHGAGMEARQPGRFQIEVHPHAASIGLFGLDRIVKYKRGLRAARALELARLRGLVMTKLPDLEPSLAAELPEIPLSGPLKPVEDQIDAVLCAYIAAHWWYWGRARNRVYGNMESGFIVVPQSVAMARQNPIQG